MKINPMNNTFTVLCERLDPDDNVKGGQFEHIVKWFAERPALQARVGQRVAVEEMARPVEGRGGARIDLVAEHRSGTLWAVQAKAYGEDTTVTMDDMARFLAESGRKSPGAFAPG
jgi:predicted helicase